MGFEHQWHIDAKISAQAQCNGKAGKNTQQQIAVAPSNRLDRQCTNGCFPERSYILHCKNDHGNEYQQPSVGKDTRHKPEARHHQRSTDQQQRKNNIIDIHNRVPRFKHYGNKLRHGTKNDHHHETQQKKMDPPCYIHLCIRECRLKKEQCQHREQIKDHTGTEKGRYQL